MNGRIKLDLNMSLFENVTQVEIDEHKEVMAKINKYYDKFDSWITSLNLIQKVVFGLGIVSFIFLGIFQNSVPLILLSIACVFAYLDWDNWVKFYFCTYITLKKFYSVHPIILIAINFLCSFFMIYVAGINASEIYEKILNILFITGFVLFLHAVLLDIMCQGKVSEMKKLFEF